MPDPVDLDRLHTPHLDLVRAQPGLRPVLEAVRRVLGLPVDVLVTGESGSGKEVVARLLHELDPVRRHAPFVPLNCAALPEALLEADLFGHRRGAFTGAGEAHAGLFRQAHGGTLFLDEVGELPPPLQPKLLRVLQERVVRPVGAAAETPVDVRVVSATNRDLPEALREGAFRPDLYYRLADYAVHVPPLRARRGDLPALADHFLRLYGQAFDCGHVRRLEPEALAWLHRCDWRANNVRQLSVVLKRAVLQCDGPALSAAHLAAAAAGIDGGIPAPAVIQDEPDERARLQAALVRTAGNLSAAARQLGMKRSTLHDRLRRHGIQRPHPTDRTPG